MIFCLVTSNNQKNFFTIGENCIKQSNWKFLQTRRELYQITKMYFFTLGKDIIKNAQNKFFWRYDMVRGQHTCLLRSLAFDAVSLPCSSEEDNRNATRFSQIFDLSRTCFDWQLCNFTLWTYLAASYAHVSKPFSLTLLLQTCF